MHYNNEDDLIDLQIKVVISSITYLKNNLENDCLDNEKIEKFEKLLADEELLLEEMMIKHAEYFLTGDY